MILNKMPAIVKMIRRLGYWIDDPKVLGERFFVEIEFPDEIKGLGITNGTYMLTKEEHEIAHWEEKIQ
jgi:hypothetical protein